MKLIILGAGGYGRTVADLANQLNIFSRIDFLDDNAVNAAVIGTCSEYSQFIAPDTYMYPAFGNGELRLQWIDQLIREGIPVPTLIHPNAYVSPTSVIGEATVVLPNAIISTDSVVKRGCLINCGAIIDHDCIIEDGTHICLGAIIKADNRIPRCTKVEAGVVIENRTYPVLVK